MAKPANKESASTIGVETFLKEVAEGTFERREAWRRVVVVGAVNLINHPLRKRIAVLPEVAIKGDIVADGGCALRVCKARASGNVVLDGSHIEEISPKSNPDTRMGRMDSKVSAKDCASLEKISGTFASDVLLDRSGIREIGADFLCGDTLSVEGCKSLRSLDCDAKTVIADFSSIEETGSNAKIENFTAVSCPNLIKATPIRNLKWARYDGSGVTEVDPKFLCRGPVTFNRCRKLARLAGEAMSIEVSMAPLERVGNLLAGMEMVFTDCKNLPTSMIGLRSETLVFTRCDLEEIPSGIHPDTDVRIAQCSDFCSLPSQWKGEISLSELPSLRETPKGFRCMGKFGAEACKNLTKIAGFVGGDLYLLPGLPALRNLESDLEVGGDLWISPAAGLLYAGCQVRGSLVASAGSLRETDVNLKVGGDADFRGSRELRILRGNFGGKVLLDQTSVEILGADLEIKGDLRSTKNPKLILLNCSVGGNVLVEDSPLLHGTGPAFWCGKKLSIRNSPNFKTLRGEINGVRRISRQKRTAARPKSVTQTSQPKSLPSPTSGHLYPPNRVYPSERFVPMGY